MTVDKPTILFTGLYPTNFQSLGKLVHLPAQCLAQNPDGEAAMPGVVERLRAGAIDCVIFAGKIAVDSFVDAIVGLGGTPDLLRGVRIVAAGVGSDAALQARGLHDFAFTPRGGSDDIVPLVAKGDRRILVVPGTHAPRDLEPKLIGRGARVSTVALWRLVPNPAPAGPLPAHDVVYFVSPAGVRAFRQAFGDDALQCEIWCLGEATRAALGNHSANAKVMVPNVSQNQDAAVKADRNPPPTRC